MGAQAFYGNYEERFNIIAGFIQERDAEVSRSNRRLENRMQILNDVFEELQTGAEELTERLELQGEVVVRQVGQDKEWSCVLEETFHPLELNLIYSYVTDALTCLRTLIVERVPDLSKKLPTLASIMRLSSSHKRIRLAWEAMLHATGIPEEDVKALCNFFLVYCDKAKYMDPSLTEAFLVEMNTIIRSVVRSRELQESLLCAIQLVEKGKIERDVIIPTSITDLQGKMVCPN